MIIMFSFLLLANRKYIESIDNKCSVWDDVCGLISMFVKYMKKLKTLDFIQLTAGGAVIAYAVSAMFGNTMFYTTVYFFLMIGCMINEKKAD